MVQTSEPFQAASRPGSWLGGELVLLHPGVDECKRRAMDRGTPDAADGVDNWERNSRMAWQPKITTPKVKQIIGEDGWPL